MDRLTMHRTEYQRLSTLSMIDSMQQLREAEGRRSAATPSTPAFHQAAQDAEQIAGDIWEQARQSDRDTPKRAPR
jgi:hypothetical protein